MRPFPATMPSGSGVFVFFYHLKPMNAISATATKGMTHLSVRFEIFNAMIDSLGS